MNNTPKMKIGIVGVSRDCFPAELTIRRRKALVDAYAKKYDAADIYECPVTIIESEIPRFQRQCSPSSTTAPLCSVLQQKKIMNP